MNNHSLNILNWDYDTVPKSSWLVSVTEEQNRDWLNNYFFKKTSFTGEPVGSSETQVGTIQKMAGEKMVQTLLTYIFLPLEWKQE